MNKYNRLVIIKQGVDTAKKYRPLVFYYIVGVVLLIFFCLPPPMNFVKFF